ncbi:MAG: SUMF1/EgtB/PvdO family nonheme iron enzyme [Saprospiraceae bacterium]|nr:SUMF1/EgtB/PvdO family nonheme iron enzyme [Saprospiraceae bacterium]
MIIIGGVFLFSFKNDESLPRPNKDYALFFAVQDYDKWGKLRNPIKDAEAIAKELKDLYGFDTLIVRNPTKNQIYDKLEAYRQRKYADDAQLLIFFSGHGDYDAATQEGFFIPKDGKLQDSYQDSYLPHTRLERQINSIPCKHILLAIDACYSGTFDKAIALSRDNSNFTRPGASDVNQQRQLFIDRALKYQSRLYLTSGAKERTPDPSEFARQFLAGLRNFGGDDQVLTFSELCGYMEKANPTPRFGEFEGNEPGGNFLFILKEATSATAPTITTRTPAQEPPRTVEKAKPEIPDFVFVKGGTYQMGDQFGEGESDEKPVHSVTVSDFYMSMNEVTFAEYDAFCSATGRTKPSDSGWGRDRRPVINISWYDAIEYCNWRSKQESLQAVYTIDKSRKDANNTSSYDDVKWTVTCNWAANGYRLPTEAEWEYAARATPSPTGEGRGGAKVRFGNGQDIARASQINFDASASYKEDYSESGTYRGKTVEVGSLNSPNELGLHDMSGNVWEWCWDWYGDKYYGESANSRDPHGPTSGQYRVVRGGSWGDSPNNCRGAYRYRLIPYFRFAVIGFRLVRH